MRKRHRVTYLAVVLAILTGLTGVVFYERLIVMRIAEIPIDVKVSDRIGFNADTDALHFGTVYPGESLAGRSAYRTTTPSLCL